MLPHQHIKRLTDGQLVTLKPKSGLLAYKIAWALPKLRNEIPPPPEDDWPATQGYRSLHTVDGICTYLGIKKVLVKRMDARLYRYVSDSGQRYVPVPSMAELLYSLGPSRTVIENIENGVVYGYTCFPVVADRIQKIWTLLKRATKSYNAAAHKFGGRPIANRTDPYGPHKVISGRNGLTVRRYADSARFSFSCTKTDDQITKLMDEIEAALA